MKKIIFIVCIFFVQFKITAQNIYYDAVYLTQEAKKPIGDVDLDTIADILSDYLPKDKIVDTSQYITIENFTKSNPFFLNIFVINRGLKTANGGNNPDFTNNSVKSIRNIGGLNVTNFADGLAKFLVERTKTELSVYFFQRFQKELNESKELQALFPSTLKVLNTIDKDIYIFEAYLNTLREAFVKDMMNFYENFQTFSKLPKYQAYFNTNPELKTILELGFYLINQYSKGVHPGEVLARIDTAKIKLRDKNLEINIRNGVEVTKLFSSSLRAKGDSTYWISEQEIEQLWKDTLLLNIYLGLIYQKGSNIEFRTKDTPPISFQTILAKLKTGQQSLKDSLDQYKLFIKTIHNDALEVETYMNMIKAKGKEKRDYNDYYLFYSASIDILQDGFLFLDLPFVDLKEMEPKIKAQSNKWITVAKSAGDLYVDVRTKNYASAVLNSVTILDELAPGENGASFSKGKAKLSVSLPEELKKLERNKKELTPEKLASLKAQYSKEVISYLDSLLATRDADDFKELREQVLKYGTFAAAVAQAKNSDEVKAAIESIALPSGSSLIKRETAWNIAVNGYVGLFLGNENIKGVGGDEGRLNAYGVTAPVGITISRGHSFLFLIPTGKCGFSTSLMLSVIDLGTVVSYRFQNDSTSSIPDIKLKDIFSPGAFLSIGMPKCPISVNFGAQIGPNLRKVYNTSTTNDVSDAMYVRWSGAICVDIPLLNLYTKARR